VVLRGGYRAGCLLDDQPVLLTALPGRQSRPFSIPEVLKIFRLLH
jgi:hypothetical protein